MKKAEKCHVSGSRNFRFSFSSLQSKLDLDENNSEWFWREVFLLPSKSLTHAKKVVAFLHSFGKKMDIDWPENSYPNFLWLLAFRSVICIYFERCEWESTRKKRKKKVGRVFAFLVFCSVTSLRIIYCINFESFQWTTDIFHLQKLTEKLKKFFWKDMGRWTWDGEVKGQKEVFAT